MIRYAEAFPAELDAAWGRDAAAILPIGALEWHGDHLPLGTDGILADRFAERLAERTGGVLMPMLWTPMTTLPHRHSLQVRPSGFRAIVDDTLAGLWMSGARRIAVVTGHYAQGHLIELAESSLGAMERYRDLRVFAGAPLEPLGRPELLDHAGRWETAQMLGVREDLVRSGEASEGSPRQTGTLGESPLLAARSEGDVVTEAALVAWTDWMDRAKSDVARGYARTFETYASYVERYGDDWDAAIMKWWTEVE